MLLPVGVDEFEIGFMVNREYWGKGYAYEVCKSLSHQALTKNYINKIIANVSLQNLASKSVLLKCKYTLVKKDENTLTYSLE